MLAGLKTMSKIAPAKIISQQSHVVPGKLTCLMSVEVRADTNLRQAEGDRALLRCSKGLLQARWRDNSNFR
jgi:hypothetical protein